MKALKPAFTPKECNALPLLAAGEHNPVFDAFRRRRLVHSRRFRIQVPRLGSSSYLSRIIRLLLAMAGAMFLFYFSIEVAMAVLPPLLAILFGITVMVAAVVFVAVLLSAAGRIAIRLKATRRRIPRRCSDVFSGGGTQNDLVIDLWLSGITGRQIVEAILLEAMERFHGRSRVVWLSFMTLLVGLVVVWAQFRLTGFACGAALLWFAWAARDLPWWGKMNLVRAGRIRTLVSDWRQSSGDNAMIRTAGSSLAKGFLYAMLIVAGLVIFFLSVIGIGILLHIADRAQWWRLEPWESVVLLGTMVLVVLAVGAHFAIPALIRMEARRAMHDLDRADAAFDQYVRVRLLGDRDKLLHALHHLPATRTGEAGAWPWLGPTWPTARPRSWWVAEPWRTWARASHKQSYKRSE